MMRQLIDYSRVSNVYLVCGYTDMRRGIDSLAGIIADNFGMDLFEDSLFLFCGRWKDRYKALYWESDGFILLYKRIENGRLQWPKNQDDIKLLSDREIRWLLDGLAVQQPKTIRPTQVGYVS